MAPAYWLSNFSNAKKDVIHLPITITVASFQTNIIYKNDNIIPMNSKTKKNSISLMAFVVVASLMMGTISMTGIDSAFSTGDKKEHKDYKSKDNRNEAEQEIEQQQFSSQRSQCVSGSNTTESCNNVALQLNNNTGSNTLGQD